MSLLGKAGEGCDSHSWVAVAYSSLCVVTFFAPETQLHTTVIFFLCYDNLMSSLVRHTCGEGMKPVGNSRS